MVLLVGTSFPSLVFRGIVKWSPFDLVKYFDELGLESMPLSRVGRAHSLLPRVLRGTFSSSSGFYLGLMQLLIFSPLRHPGSRVLSGEHPLMSRI